MFRDHVWEPLPEYDLFKCGVCGLIAATTVIGTDDPKKLPACSNRTLDDEFKELLAGEIPEAEEELGS